MTQPGRIAIVYSQGAEAHEYRGYIDYLQSLGFLTGEVEDPDVAASRASGPCASPSTSRARSLQQRVGLSDG